MQIQYDAKADAMYIKLNNAPVQKTHQFNDRVLLKTGADGNVVGIELLSVSRFTDDVQEVIYRYISPDSPPPDLERLRNITPEKSQE
jgi:uncharacterized protein YuzE